MQANNYLTYALGRTAFLNTSLEKKNFLNRKKVGLAVPLKIRNSLVILLLGNKNNFVTPFDVFRFNLLIKNTRDVLFGVNNTKKNYVK